MSAMADIPAVSNEDLICHRRWGWSRIHVHRHIQAAEAVKEMSPIGDIPNVRKERWGWNASRSRQLIGAAEAVANMQSVTNVTPAKLPTVANEGQTRELAVH
jgi:hypothetical protein